MKSGIKSWQNLSFLKKLGLSLAAIYLLLVVFLVLLAPALPLPFLPNHLDLENPYLEPAFLSGNGISHWLGTDGLGRDVLANVVFGFRTGFFIALPVMVLAMAVGISLGLLGGFYGNRQLRLSRGSLIAGLLFILLGFFYGYYIFRFEWAELGSGKRAEGLVLFLKAGSCLLICGGFCWFLNKLLKTLSFFRKKVSFPFDELLLKTTELLSTVPRLVLVLCFAAALTSGYFSLFILLSLTFWVGPARLTRSETLRLKKLPFIEAAKVSGLPDSRILRNHILPNAAGVLITTFCFGLGSLLGLESGLSFLGIGLPPETPGWGRLLAGFRLYPEAWWLLVFPGVALWFLILSIQAWGNFFQKALLNK